MSLSLRLAVLLFFSSLVFSSAAGFAEKSENKFYIISLKDTYANKKYKVRAFFFNPGSFTNFYNTPKIPDGWHYTFNGERSIKLVAAAFTDKESVDIGFFKDFLSFLFQPDYIYIKSELYFEMKLIYYKPDGTPGIIVLHTEDFIVKEIHKDLKVY